MQLDFRTVCIAGATVLAGFGITLLVLSTADRRQRELHLFGLAMSLLAVGNVLIALRGLIPDFISIVAANLVICGGVLSAWRGSREMVSLPPRPAIEAVSMFLTTGLILYCTYGRSEE